jgi:tetratricopeptide (TPR) repeat protein
MQRVKRLVAEIHRRSLWQVLGIYVLGSWAAYQVILGLTDGLGMPDWVPPFAIVLFMIGLPVVVATAFVQEGVGVGRAKEAAGEPESRKETGALEATEIATTRDAPAPSSAPEPLHHRILTWRNAIVGGVLAFALLGVSVAAYFVMRVAGIGPAASLAAQGVFDDRERIVLADFANATSDSLLSDVVTKALRIDLLQSSAIAPVEPSDIAAVLRRMQRTDADPLTAEVALEVAQREGIKAVLEGEIGALGSGYVVTATLRAAEGARSLAGFRVTAKGADELIAAVDKLSQQIREKSGESLRSIRAEEPLEQVTTHSLPALRKMTEGLAAFDEGNETRAIALTEEALALDTAFAMAWRQLGVLLVNTRMDRARQVDALSKAYRFRERLTEQERYLATAMYFTEVTPDRDQVMQAYQNVLRLAPDDRIALNNLANLHDELEQLGESEAMLRRAVGGPGRSSTASYNLVRILFMQSKFDEARTAVGEFETTYPRDASAIESRAFLELFAENYDAAEALGRRLADSVDLSAPFRRVGSGIQAMSAHIRGRAAASVAFRQQARRIAPTVEGDLMAIRFESYFEDPKQLERRLDDLTEAEAWTSRPIATRPYEWLITAHTMVGAPEKARRYLAEWEGQVPAEVRGPDFQHLRQALLGSVALQEGKLTEAIEALEAARTGFHCRRCYRAQLAAAYEAAGRPDEAIALYESILTELEGLYPVAAMERPVAIERLGPLYEARGDTVNAKRYYARFAELWKDADPKLQPRVRAATAALERLRGPG